MISGVALLVSLSLLFASTPVVNSWGGNLKPLMQAYFWSSANTLATGYFYNSSTGTGVVGQSASGWGVSGSGLDYGVYGYGSASGGQGVFGGCAGASCTGVVGYGPYLGMYGAGNYIGMYGYSTSTAGYGVYGYCPNNIGVYGYGSVRGGDFYGSGSSGYGVSGAAPWEGVRGVASATSGAGVVGGATNSGGYGGYFWSDLYRGLYSDGASGWYDAYFPDFIGVGSSVYSGLGMSIIALNDGSEALEPGDLVAFSRFVTSAEDSGPTLAVEKVNGANSFAFVGVAQKAYVKEEVPAEAMQHAQRPARVQEVPVLKITPKERPAVEGEGSMLPPPVELQREELAAPAREIPAEASRTHHADAAGRFVEGSAAPGQYVLVMVQGIAQVKVDASAAPVRAGDMLTASATGYAINATVASQPDAAERPREGVAESGDHSPVGASPQVLTIGRALESLESGTGTIYVFVSVR